MRIIALMNQKGGVGKTTTTVNLGAALAELGKRVCLIDLDPQAHLTINYGTEPGPDVVNLYNVLVEERPITEALRPIDRQITLIPSSIDLAAAEIELVSVLGRELLLKRRIEAAQAAAAQSGSDAKGFDFDYVLLDCPPSLGLLTINALAVATEVLVPMQAHFFSLQGVAKLLETVQLVNKRMNPGLRVTGIVLTMYDAQTKLSTEVVGELNGFIEAAKGKSLPWSDAKVFNSRIRRNIKLAESPSFGQTILVYEPSSNGAADYRALARELLGISEASAADLVKETKEANAASAANAAGATGPASVPTPVAATPPTAVKEAAQPKATPSPSSKGRSGKSSKAGKVAKAETPAAAAPSTPSGAPVAPEAAPTNAPPSSEGAPQEGSPAVPTAPTAPTAPTGSGKEAAA